MFTGDASFSGTSSSGLFVAVMTASSLEIPFCNTLASLDIRFVTVVEVVFDVDFDVRVFFVGEIAEAFAGDDFPTDVRVFAMPVVVPIGTEERALVLGADAPEREICLLTVSLLCLSINGDFPVAVIVLFSRGLVMPPEVGAVLGRAAPLTPVVDCFNVDVGLVVEVADMGLGFDVTLDVDVFVVVDGLISVFAVVLVVVLTVVLVGFVVAGLLANFVSPLTVDFFSIDVGVLTFDKVVVVVVVFGLVVADRGEALVLVAVVIFLGITVVFVMVLPVVLETVVLVDPSNCLGRVAVLVAGFFKVDCDAGNDVVVRIVVLIALEGEVGDFVAVFVVVFVVLFVGRFALVVVAVFAFELAMTTAAVVAMMAASTDTCATSVTSFDLSIVVISSRTSTIFCNSISSCFGGIFSEIISSFNTSSSTLADTNSAAFSSICSCSIGSLVSIVIGTDSLNI